MCLQHCQICASDRCGVVDAGVDGAFSRFRPARVLADGGVVLTPMAFESIGARVQAKNAHHVCIYTTHAHVENTHSRARCECRRGNMKWLRPWNLTSCWFSLSLSLYLSLSPSLYSHTPASTRATTQTCNTTARIHRWRSTVCCGRRPLATP